VSAEEQPGREDDGLDWEGKPEEIPPSLQQKWDKDAERGVRAGVCKNCGATYNDEDLSCRYCAQEVKLKSSDPKVAWFFKSVWGAVIALLVLLCFLGLVLY